MLDRALRMRKIPAAMRPLHAWCHLADGEEHRDTRCADRPELGDGFPQGEELTRRVSEWFEARYGQRLHIETGPGRIVLLVHYEPWVVELPAIGSIGEIFVSTTERVGRPPQIWVTAEPMRINVLDQFVDLPEGLRGALQPAELAVLLRDFTLGLEARHALHSVASRVRLAAEARAALDAAVRSLTAPSPHYGHVRWSALQALEKALKGFLRQSGASIPHHHKLANLHARAVSTGLQALPAEHLVTVQCDAGIRYGEAQATLVEAYAAYWSSLLACGQIARQLKARLPRRRRRASAPSAS